MGEVATNAIIGFIIYRTVGSGGTRNQKVPYLPNKSRMSLCASFGAEQSSHPSIGLCLGGDGVHTF